MFSERFWLSLGFPPGEDVDLIFHLRLSTGRAERIQTQQYRPTAFVFQKKNVMHSLWLAFFCTFLLCSCFFAVVFSCDFAPWLCLHLVLCSFNPLDKEACLAEIAPSVLSKNKRSKLSAAGEGKKHSMSLVPVSCSP